MYTYAHGFLLLFDASKPNTRTLCCKVLRKTDLDNYEIVVVDDDNDHHHTVFEHKVKVGPPHTTSFHTKKRREEQKESVERLVDFVCVCVMMG